MKKLIIIICLLLLIIIKIPIPQENTKQETEQPEEHLTAVTRVWEKREDLQTLFPDKINGTNEMEDWTLTQWAEEFGWKEYRSLRQYNEQTERDYIYNKYLPIERAINKIASRKYVLNEYDCKHFSLDLKIELEKENISSKMITGFGNTSGHRWLAIEIDPTSGRFVETNEFNNEFPIQSLTEKYLRSINR